MKESILLSLSFFTKLTLLSWWRRLFRWKEISAQIQEEKEKLSKRYTELESHLEYAQKETSDLRKSNQSLAEQKDDKESQLNEEKKKTALFIQEKELKQHEYEKRVDDLNKANEQVHSREKDIEREREERQRQKQEKLKKNWSDHELHVEEKIKSLCQKHQIEYIDKEQYPFRGKPDNAIKICDELIIFDAKAPASDDLSHFKKYIKDQAETAKKYAKKNEVKNEIFLVVPNNAIEELSEYCFDLADYKVFVVATDSLEPILLSLKKIETYEFAETLSPEDRQLVCTIIGKMAYGIKRRIQVDQYFAKEFIALLSQADTLPKEILEESLKVEKASKLNPPMGKRSKTLPLKEIQKDHQHIAEKIRGEGINDTKGLEKIEDIPLYRK